jgi:diketogulonate reductase-like aldo/keto reductase
MIARSAPSKTQLTISSTTTLNNGVKMPLLGLGVYQTRPGKETEDAVTFALKAGYRHIDTAAYYRNEESVGAAVKKSSIPRKDIFITTKLANIDHENPKKAFEASNKRLGLDYIDLYLIHWPQQGQRDHSWKELEQLQKEKKVRAIGVSNYTVRHLKELLAFATTIPAVNQVEFSPYLYQKELLDFCIKNKIQLEAYAPLTEGQKLDEEKLVKLAKKYGKTPAQILIRWELQHQIIAIPKSSKEERIKENANVYDFAISPTDMTALDKFNENFRVCWDPTNAP